MQIKQVEMIPLALPLKTNFKTAHDAMTIRPLTLLVVTMMDGTIGLGEIQSFDNANYAAETQAMSRAALPEFIQLLKHKEWTHPSQISAILAQKTGFNFARAGLEMACWDAYGKSNQQSLAQLIGAKHACVPVSRVIGLQPDSKTTLKAIQQAVMGGYRRIKLKMTKIDDLPDLSGFKQDDLIFSVDFNNALIDNNQTVKLLEQLQAKGINLVEEPLQGAPWLSYQDLVASKKVPLISLDESINQVADVQRALQSDAADAFTLKPGKLGGVQATLSAQSKINAADKLPWIGGMLSSGIGRFVDVALAASQPTAIFPADSGPTQVYLLTDIIEETLKLHDGSVAVSRQPGIGVTLNWQKVKKYQSGMRQIF